MPDVQHRFGIMVALLVFTAKGIADSLDFFDDATMKRYLLAALTG
ncbi:MULTISPECIES: hypothetical protein [Symbiopectobacterium]|nr:MULTISPECIES: hypothetical protein [Symbiopectobacterium]